MRGMKIYNGANGLLYSLYGLAGVITPGVVFEANAIQQVGVHGTHSIRALWGGICVLGLLILWRGFKATSARSTTLAIALVSAGLVGARLLGVALDGTEGMGADQFGPLIIESVMTVVGVLLLLRKSDAG